MGTFELLRPRYNPRDQRPSPPGQNRFWLSALNSRKTNTTHQIHHSFHWLGPESLDLGHIFVVIADSNLLGGLSGSVVVKIIVRREDKGSLGK